MESSTVDGFKTLSMIGVYGVAVLLWLRNANLDRFPALILTVVAVVLLVFGLWIFCGWTALTLSRRMRFLGDESAAFADALIGDVTLFVLNYQV